MSRHPYAALAAALAFAACAAPVSPPAPGPTPGASPAVALGAANLTPEQAAATITPRDVYARVEFLAADRMRGRDTPSPELEIAASYLVNQYRLWGLEPAGENGTFYQWWPFRGRRGGQGPEVPVPNVVAVLPGSDPALGGEYVVLSAHMDHVGVDRPVGGDSIYNGADDNASGTTALLEVAEALARMGTRPRRSIVFLHVSGEEKGLLGSAWYSEHPTVPLPQIVANVNVDMIGGNDPAQAVIIGMRYSSLGALASRVSTARPELGLTLTDDPWPEERFFFRSDHFNFARKEVPSIFFFSGVHENYHQPSDEVERLDADKAARISRLVFYTVLEIANDPARPTWDPAGLAEVRRMRR